MVIYLTEYDWMLAVGVIFGFSLLLTVMTYRNLASFIIFAMIISGFMVFTGLIDLWVLVLFIIIFTLMFIVHIKKDGGSG